MAINKTSDLKHLTFTVTYCGLLFGISNQIWIRPFYNIHILNAEKTEIAREIGISFLLLFSGTDLIAFPYYTYYIFDFFELLRLGASLNLKLLHAKLYLQSQ